MKLSFMILQRQKRLHAMNSSVRKCIRSHSHRRAYTKTIRHDVLTIILRMINKKYSLTTLVDNFTTLEDKEKRHVELDSLFIVSCSAVYRY